MFIKLPELKRGNVFQYNATWENAQLIELKSQVRDYSNRLICDVNIEPTGIENKYRFFVLETSSWPLGTLYTDIKRTVNGVKESSITMTIDVIRGVTE